MNRITLAVVALMALVVAYCLLGGAALFPGSKDTGPMGVVRPAVNPVTVSEVVTGNDTPSVRESVEAFALLVITDTKHRPVSGAQVFAIPSNDADSRFYRRAGLRHLGDTVADGSLRISSQGAALDANSGLRCLVVATNHASAEVNGVLLGHRYNVTMAPSYSIDVECRLISEMPVEGAVISLSRAFPGGGVPEAIDELIPSASFAATSFAASDARGSVRIDGLSEGDYVLSASKENHAPVSHPVLIAVPPRDSEPIAVLFDQIFVSVVRCSVGSMVLCRPWVDGMAAASVAAPSLDRARRVLQEQHPDAEVAAVLLQWPRPGKSIVRWEAVFGDRAPSSMIAQLRPFADMVTPDIIAPESAGAPSGAVRVTVAVEGGNTVALEDIGLKFLDSEDSRRSYKSVPCGSQLRVPPGRYIVGSQSLSPDHVKPKIIDVVDGSSLDVSLECASRLHIANLRLRTSDGGCPSLLRLTVTVTQGGGNSLFQMRQSLVGFPRKTVIVPAGEMTIEVASHGYKALRVIRTATCDLEVDLVMEPMRW